MKNLTPTLLMTTILAVLFQLSTRGQTVTNTIPIADDTVTVFCFAGHTTAVNLSPSVIDPDGGAMTFSIGASSNPALIQTQTTGWMSFNIQSKCGAIGDYFIPFNVQDTTSTTTVLNASGVIHCIVVDSNYQSINLAPAANNDYFLIDSAIPSLINLLANDYDPNGDVFTYPTILSPPTLGTVTSTNGFFTFSPNISANGIDSFQYVVCDTLSLAPVKLCDTAQAFVFIRGKSNNIAPSAADDFVGTLVNTQINIDVLRNDFDQNGDSLIITNTFYSGLNAIVGITADNKVRYNPNTVFVGFDTLFYSVCDFNPPPTVVVPAIQCDTAMVVIAVSNPLSTALASQKNVRCFGESNGEILSNPADGIKPYRYSWSTGASIDSIINLASGDYFLTVWDALCRYKLDTFTISEPTQLSATISFKKDVSCFGGADGMAVATPQGGTAPFLYAWNHSISFHDDTAFNLFSGPYSVTISDSNNCIAYDTTFINQPTQLTLSIGNDTAFCAGDSVLYMPSAGGGTPLYIYDWSNGSTVQNQFLTSSGTYILTVTDGNLCTTTDTVNVIASTSCVYPGDADYNGITDNDDLLPIGLAYDSIGPLRSNANIVWIGQYANDWSDTTLLNINRKHADCNGDGIVNANDTLAIVQNWGLTHQKNNEQKIARAGLPMLNVVMPSGPFVTGDTIFASIQLGDVSIGASNVYGLSFTFNYTSVVVDSSKSSLLFGNSWLANTNEKIAISKNFPLSGFIKAAVTRIDHTSRSGFGEIATARLVINTDNIDGKDYAALPFLAYITNVKALDNNGNILEVNEGSDTSTVNFVVNGISPTEEAIKLSAYPNPATKQLFIETEKAHIKAINLYSMIGLKMHAITSPSSKERIDLAGFAAGTYLLEVVSNRGDKKQVKILVQ